MRSGIIKQYFGMILLAVFIGCGGGGGSNTGVDADLDADNDGLSDYFEVVEKSSLFMSNGAINRSASIAPATFPQEQW
jgi:hypothetical protein